MIASHDRSYYIGASDTDKVVGNWKTKTWEKWWLQKIGINQDRFDNRYTIAGTNWEHRILESLNIQGLELDKQFIIEDLRLRVNLDGNTPDRIKECKTYKWEKGFSVPKKYREQVQVQMFGSGIHAADIVSYGLVEADYDNFFRDIDHGRLHEHPIEYDQKWIDSVYLPRLRILADCLKRGVFPSV